MKRRDFLIGAAAATTLTGASKGWARGRDDEKRARIAIMMFGLNSIVKTNMPPGPDRTIELMDIGQICADRFHVHNVELQSNYFPSTEKSYLKDLKVRLDRTKTKIVQINLELEGIRTMLSITSGLVHAGITYDLPAAMAVCRELRYTGLYSIKAIGQPGNPLDNTQKILDGVLATM